MNFTLKYAHILRGCASLLVVHFSLEQATQALAASCDDEDIVAALAKRIADIAGLDGESHCMSKHVPRL